MSLIVAAGRGGRDHPNVLIRAEPGTDATAESARTAGSANRSAQRSPDDIDHLVHVLLGLTTLGCGTNTTANMVLQDHDPHRVEGRPQGGGLLEDVDAVLLALDHPGDAPHLAFDAAEPRELGFLEAFVHA